MSRSREILERAQALTDRLRELRPPTKRSVFLALVEGAETDRQALLHRLDLATTGSGGHLGRTGSYPDQLQATAGVLREELQAEDDLEPKGLASCLGWVGRLLYVAEKLEGGGNGNGGPSARTRSGSGAGPGTKGAKAKLPGDEDPSDREVLEPSKLGLSGKALGDLASLKRRLEEGDPNGDGG